MAKGKRLKGKQLSGYFYQIIRNRVAFVNVVCQAMDNDMNIIIYIYNLSVVI